jgi:serine protease AprX
MRIPNRNRALQSGLLAVLAGFVLVGSGVAADRPLIGENVASGLAARGDTLRVWVFLDNKDPLGSGLGRVTLSTSWISARAVNRRQLKGLTPVTEEDRPVSPDAVAYLENAGLRLRTVSRWFTAVSGWIDRPALEAIAAIPWIDSIRVVRVYRRPAEPEIPARDELYRQTVPAGDTLAYGPSFDQAFQIGITEAHRMGYTGLGVLIGFLDTGFNLDHPAFADANVLATWDFINGDPDVNDEDTLQMDHGTKTWSVCGGYYPDSLIGAAFGAEFALGKTEIKNEVDTEAEEDLYVEGLWWLDSLGVDIVSTSLGYPDGYDYGDLNGRTALSTIAVNHVASRGVLVVTAAGNEGYNVISPWIIPPADSDSALAVGAVYLSGQRAGFSSIGPTADGRIKPDVMALGVGVRVAGVRPASFLYGSGTSFATPLVSGACALMLEKEPGLMPMEVIARLHETSGLAGFPNNEMGYGLVNLPQAMDLQGDSVFAGENVFAYPNPFTGLIRFVMPEETPFSELTQMRIFTAAGEMVYSNEFTGRLGYWDGTNNAGRHVAGGVYLCLFKTSIAEYTIKVVFMPQE